MITACSSGGDDGNQTPVANAGLDQILVEGTQVQLDGSGSSDPDSDALTYQWTQTSGPVVSLSNPSAVNPAFTAPGGESADQALEFSLVVNDGELSSAADAVTVTVQPAPPAAANGFVTRTVAALSHGRFTLNNVWTRDDLIAEGFKLDDPDLHPNKLAYDVFASQSVRPYTTMITEYEARRRQCEDDFNLFYPRAAYTVPPLNNTYHFTDRKCYPTLQIAAGLEESTRGDNAAQQTLQRYGYYCGGGFPEPRADHADAPEPLDGVDYCCRLHDGNIWSNQKIPNPPVSDDSSNECGIAMCLRQATVKGISALPPDVETSRQHWWGNGIVGGATFVCGGFQETNARAPVPEP